MIEIDTEKCTNCGVCYDLCPGITYGVRSDNEHKEVYIRYSEFCFSCGHCMAFCKPQAIVHPELSYDDFEDLREINITPDDMKNLLFSRRSVRRYKEEAVPEDLIDDLIEVATHAGTGSNQQTVAFTVVRDKRLLQKLEQAILEIWLGMLKPLDYKAALPVLRMMYGPETTDLAQMYYEVYKHKQKAGELEGSIFYNAPALILAHDIGKNSIGPTNCAIAMRNIEILALTMGLGTCWCGFLTGAANRKPRKINKLIKLDSSRRIWGALMIGYPRYKSKVKIPRVEREVIYF